MASQSVRHAFETQLIVNQIRELKTEVSKEYDVPAAMRDEMSERSAEIMMHFGPETPVKLNDYCCMLEDALISSIKTMKAINEKHQLLLDEAARLRELVNSQDA